MNIEIVKNKKLFRNKCPDGITVKMLNSVLLEEGSPTDLHIDYLWGIYCKINFSPNKFGIYIDDETFHKNPSNMIVPLIKETGNKYVSKITKITKSKSKTRTSKSKTRKRSIPFLGGTAYIPAVSDGLILDPVWRPNYTTLVTINHAGLQQIARECISVNDDDQHDIVIRPLELYGSSMPINTNWDCFKTLMFYMYVKKINRLVSFQCCSTTTHENQLSSCRVGQGSPENRHWEDRTWNILKQLHDDNINDPNIQMINIDYQDMTMGSLLAWSEIRNLNFHQAEQRTLMHCLAGLGRTGSAMLFHALYEIIYADTTRTIIREPFLKKQSSGGLFSMLLRIARQISFKTEPDETAEIQTKIRQFNINRIYDELFKITNTTSANLFIARINNILIQLVLKLGDDNHNVYLYPLHPVFPDRQFTRINVFLPPIEVSLSPVNLTDAAVHQTYGLTPLIVIQTTPDRFDI